MMPHLSTESPDYKAALDKEFVSHPRKQRKRWGESAFRMGWISGQRRNYPYRGQPCYAQIWLRGYLAFIECEQALNDRRHNKQIEWLTDRIDDLRFEYTSGNRMKAIRMGWQPDWKKPILVLDEEAKVFLRQEVIRIEQQKGMDNERYNQLRERLANQSPVRKLGTDLG